MPLKRGIFVARAGFEPTHAEPKSAVLPLDDRAIIFSTASIAIKIELCKFFIKKFILFFIKT